MIDKNITGYLDETEQQYMRNNSFVNSDTIEKLEEFNSKGEACKIPEVGCFDKEMDKYEYI